MRLTSTNAARLFGLAGRKGTLAPGADADLVLWNPDAERALTNSDLHHAIDYTPWEGMRLKGLPTMTIRRGEIAVRDGQVLAEPGSGRFLARGPTRSPRRRAGCRTGSTRRPGADALDVGRALTDHAGFLGNRHGDRETVERRGGGCRSPRQGGVRRHPGHAPLGFINNFWRALANQPAVLERTWADLKQVMAADGALDPLTKELIYIAVSTANGCSYCIHSPPPPRGPRA